MVIDFLLCVPNCGKVTGGLIRTVEMRVGDNKKAPQSQQDMELYYSLSGSGGRTRTGMTLRSADFESAVSTISPLRQRR